MKYYALLLLIFSGQLSLIAQPYGQPSELPEGFTAQYIFGGNINNHPPIDPISMDFIGDTTILLTSKDGKVYAIENGILNDTPLLSIAVDEQGERGLQGIAVDPEFEFNHFIYLYYAVPGGNFNRVSRFMYHDGHIHAEEEAVLLEIDQMSDQVFFHNGGNMEFGSDGKLYIGTGDGSKPSEAQSQTSLLGKILRINRDGTVPTDNPFYFQNEGIYKAIYALGFRNPFKFNFKNDGRLFSNDVGNATWEEINEVSPGKNYGWPLVEGKLADNPSAVPPPNYVDPGFTYSHSEGCAITGGAFYDKPVISFPIEYANKYFYSDFCTRYLYSLNITTGESVPFMLSHFTPTHISVNKQGDLYYFGFPGGGSGELWRISYSTNAAPSITSHPQNVLLPVGDSAVFSIASSGKTPITYQWFKNGAPIEGATASTFIVNNVSLADNGTEFYCKVVNEISFIESNVATLSVTNRTRPSVSIEFLSENQFYVAGDTIIVKGLAVDEVQGNLPKEALHWRVDFNHDFHYHPFISSIVGVDSISFVVPKLGETSSNVWFRVYLTAENDIGLTKTDYADISPKVSIISVTSPNDEIDIAYLDGTPFSLPFDISAVAGMTRLLNVTDTVVYSDESILLFKGWNNSKYSTTYLFDVPETDSVFTVNYDKYLLGTGSGLRVRFYNSPLSAEDQPDTTFVSEVIDFTWSNGIPVEGINADDFVAIWDGFIRVPVGGNYKFHIQADGGVSLMIGENTIINDLADSGLEQRMGEITLEEGSIYPIKLKYFDASGDASIRLSWSHERFPEIVVPLLSQYDQHYTPQLSFVNSEEDMFYLNQTIGIKASAKDYSGDNILTNSINWTVQYTSEEYSSLLYEFNGLDTISFVVPDTLLYREGAHLTISVQATDRNGFSENLLKEMTPSLANVQLKSDETDVEIMLGESIFSLPYENTFIKGYPLQINLIDSVFSRENVLYYFSELNNGTTLSFNVNADTLVRFDYGEYDLNTGTGLNAEYFSGSKTFEDSPDSIRLDSIIDFAHQNLSENIKVRWSAWVTPPESGQYQLTAESSGAVVISIKEEVFNLNNQGEIINNQTISMLEGGYYPMEVLYQSDSVSGYVRLLWTSADLPTHGVPMQQLFTELPGAVGVDNGVATDIITYPNPVQSLLTLEATEATDFADISIKSSAGILILQTQVLPVDGKMLLDVSGLSPGLYFISVRSGDLNSVIKFLKN